jgi:hypothetical protein
MKEEEGSKNQFNVVCSNMYYTDVEPATNG